MKKIYKGLIIESSNSEEDSIISLAEGDITYFISELIMNSIEIYGNFLSVRYFISDKELSENELKKELLKKLYGSSEAFYCVQYSDITGYLWTDDVLNVGGHDLIEELRANLNKYLWMEIEYNKKGSK